MSKGLFPDFVRRLRSLPAPSEDQRAWELVGNGITVLFYEVDDGADVPEHAHGPEWGVVLAGRMDITIDGETKAYERGDTYFIPDGTPHSVVNHPGLVGIDLLADA